MTRTLTVRSDFALLSQAQELGGYAEAQELTGINSGHKVTTGFSHGAVLGIADKIIDAVKQGAITLLVVGTPRRRSSWS